MLFDLDGVLTRTASVHAAAWKRLFDEFLEQRAADTGEAFVTFDIDADYRRYVDGKPRYDGVAAFLASRGIALPFGAPVDGLGTHTAHLHCPLGVSVHDLEGDIFANAGRLRILRLDGHLHL